MYDERFAEACEMTTVKIAFIYQSRRTLTKSNIV